MTGSNCLKNNHTCSKLHHLYTNARNVRLQRIPRCQTSTNCDDVSKTCEQSESCCSLNLQLALWHHHLHVCIHSVLGRFSFSSMQQIFLVRCRIGTCMYIYTPTIHRCMVPVAHLKFVPYKMVCLLASPTLRCG